MVVSSEAVTNYYLEYNAMNMLLLLVWKIIKVLVTWLDNPKLLETVSDSTLPRFVVALF